jgi:hypothetical protein
MWLLLIIAVHMENPKDVPGRVTLEFSTLEECKQAQSTLQWQLKFPQFKVTSQCIKQS